MNQKIIKKLSIDAVMIILIIIEMAYRITGNLLHEVLGITLLSLFLIHNILNIEWYKRISKVKLDVKRISSIIINVLLLISMLALIISGIIISKSLFRFTLMKDILSAREIHMQAAYWSLILVSVHLGMHWEMIISVARKIFKIKNKNLIRTVILNIFTILIVIYGIKASCDRNIGARLIAEYIPGFWKSDKSISKVLLDYSSIMGIYIAGAYYALKVFKKVQIRK